MTRSIPTAHVKRNDSPDPTAITMGPEVLLYVSDYGFGFPPGTGQIVTVDPPCRQRSKLPPMRRCALMHRLITVSQTKQPVEKGLT